MKKFLFQITMLINALAIAIKVIYPIYFVILGYLTSSPVIKGLVNFSFEDILISLILILNINFLYEIQKKYEDRDLIIKDLKNTIKYIELLEFKLKNKDFLEKFAGEKIDEHRINSILVLHNIDVYKQLLKDYENEK